MIAAIDIFCIVIAVTMIFYEGQRGVALAVVDLVGVGAGVIMAGKFYGSLLQHIPTVSNAYLVSVIVPILIVAGISAFLTYRTKEHVTGVEAALGAMAGLAIGVFLSYAIYQYLTMKYGPSAQFLRNSLLAYQFDEQGVVHEMSSFMRTLMGR